MPPAVALPKPEFHRYTFTSTAHIRAVSIQMRNSLNSAHHQGLRVTAVCRLPTSGLLRGQEPRTGGMRRLKGEGRLGMGAADSPFLPCWATLRLGHTDRHGWGEGATWPAPVGCPGSGRVPRLCPRLPCTRPSGLDKSGQEQITTHFLYGQRFLVTDSGGICGGCFYVIL